MTYDTWLNKIEELLKTNNVVPCCPIPEPVYRLWYMKSLSPEITIQRIMFAYTTRIIDEIL